LISEMGNEANETGGPWFKSILVFHFAKLLFVVGLKAFEHISYRISRVVVFHFCQPPSFSLLISVGRQSVNCKEKEKAQHSFYEDTWLDK
jgi:hypothetical protein